MEEDLAQIFKETSSITFITGKRGFGKTDFAFLLLETALKQQLLTKIASNVRMRHETRVEYIPYYDRMQKWLETEGKKGFLLDELGKHLNRMRFMTEKSKLILDICQLIRKYDAHLIGIAPSPQLINKLFLNTDILDCFIVKLSKKIARVRNYVTRESYLIDNIPRTQVPFISKDIALFKLRDPDLRTKLDTLPQCCRASWLYLKHRSLRKVGKVMDLSHEEIRKLLNKHLSHSEIEVSTVNVAR